MGSPKLSIVTPVYNRGSEIRRCLDSCLGQSFADFEVVVVDDGSTDESYRVASTFDDPRIRLLRHETNQGHGVARNTAIANAKGEWVIFLDSDDELLPGGLDCISQAIDTVGSGVHRLAFVYRRDDGRVSPVPSLPNGVMGYQEYLEWLEDRELYDFVCCTKRETFAEVPQPNRRWADQSVYHLDFAHRYLTHCFRDEVALVHTDASNRISHLRRSLGTSITSAVDLGNDLDLLFARHGDALREHAPRTYEMFRRMRAAYYFLAGQRMAGLRKMTGCLRATPWLPEAWMLLIVGLAGPGGFAALRSRRLPST